MREYETIFVTCPDAGESQTNQLLERVDDVIKRHGGEIIQQKNWGKKDLAYRVKKYNQGIYFYYNYAGDFNTVSDLERTLRLHELPMKFLTVKLADKVDVDAKKEELAKLAEKATVSETPARKESSESEEGVKDA